MVEAMVALTLVDQLMLQRAQCELFPDETPQETRSNPLGKTAHREGGPKKARQPIAVGTGPMTQRVDEE
jgi:hypothetical protein